MDHNSNYHYIMRVSHDHTLNKRSIIWRLFMVLIILCFWYCNTFLSWYYHPSLYHLDSYAEYFRVLYLHSWQRRGRLPRSRVKTWLKRTCLKRWPVTMCVHSLVFVVTKHIEGTMCDPAWEKGSNVHKIHLFTFEYIYISLSICYSRSVRFVSFSALKW